MNKILIQKLLCLISGILLILPLVLHPKVQASENMTGTEQNEIEIERSIQEKAYKCINRMMEGAKV